MNPILKVTSTLADPTRFSIYEFILEHKTEATVQDVADAFHIHPNVARLHLTKLEDVDLIVSHLQKTGKGGRPGKLYKAADKAVQLSFPHRDYQLLSTILIKSVALLGEKAWPAVEAASVQAGKEAAEQAGSMKAHSLDEQLAILSRLSERIGYVPAVKEGEQGRVVEFSIYNCPFKELLDAQSELACRIHKSFLEGVVVSLFGTTMLAQYETIADGCSQCSYHAIVTN